MRRGIRLKCQPGDQVKLHDCLCFVCVIVCLFDQDDKMMRWTSTMASVRQMRREAAGDVQGGAPRSWTIIFDDL